MTSRFVMLALVWLSILIVPCTSQGAIQFRGASKDIQDSAAILVANKPAGTTDGDLLVAWASHDNSGGTWTPPPGQGWTAFSLPGTESSFTSRAWYKQVDAADASRTDYTFTYSNSNDAILYLAAFYEDSGTGNWTLEDGTGWAFAPDATSLSNGGVTAVDNSLFLVGYANDDNEVVTGDPSGPAKIDEDSTSSLAFAAYYETVDAIDGSVSYSVTWGGGNEQLSAMAAIFSWASDGGGPGPSVCQVDPGGTYIEAENFTGTILQGATFAVESTTPGFNGSGYLRSTGGSTTSPPVHEGKIYNINFATPGTYNVWMRGYALDGGSDSAFIGLNGTSVGALNEGGTYNAWVWSNGIQTGSNQITVPAAGYHDFNTWIREANHRIDGFYITQGGETPTGGIPSGTPTLDPTQCAVSGANLALTSTDSPDPVSVGGTITYSLTATNNGPADASNVTLVDTLPSDVAWQSATPSQGSCVHSGEPLGGTVTCTLGTIANGASTTVDIDVIAPGTPGVISNSATVSADESDPDASNNTALEQTIVGGANLSLSQSDAPDPVLVNQVLSYSLVVDNLGPDDATDVVLVDTLPATVTFLSAISSQGSCSEAGGTVTCNLGTIVNAANASVDIIVTAPPNAGSITNDAVVSTSATDSDAANDSASETTTVQNLNVNQLCYLVADAGGSGGGNDLLTSIDTADFNPLTNETNIGIGTGTSTIEAIAWNSATGVLYAANAGQLGTLNTTTGVFTALPSSFGTGSGALGNINFTDVDGLTYDATTGVLYGSERQTGTDVLIQIDMATGAHVPNAFGAGIDYVPMPPILGNTLTDDIAVDPTTGIMYAAVNSGGSTDRLITVNKATGATTDVSLITVPDIEGLGTDPTGQLWGTSGTQGILYELDKVTGVGSNGRPIDNGSDYESVDCYAFSPSVVADLAVTKIVDDAAPAEGATATYTVTATNTGPGIATVVQISDVLPAGVTFDSVVTSQGTYSSTTGEWFVGTLNAGSNATLNLQASVDTGTAGSTITNTASVTFVSQNDPNAGNDVASADIIPVALPASLLVLKSVSTVRDPLGATAPAALAIPGAVVQYEISVSNSGGGAATETVITDTLNSNLTFLAGEFDGGAADIEIIVGTAAPVYCIAEVGGDTNSDGCFLNAAGDDLTVTIPVSASYPNGLTVGATAPENVVVVHFRATVD